MQIGVTMNAKSNESHVLAVARNPLKQYETFFRTIKTS